MTFKHRSLSVRTRIALTLAAGVAGSLLMAGCGLGDAPAASTGVTTAASFSGKINGGPNPIAGATVKLFITGSGGTNGGYGAGTFVQEAKTVGTAGQDTGADGSFSFVGGYPCPAGQFLYIVSSGGNTGNGFNAKAYLVAALGRCDDLFSAGTYTGGFIYLNELSTVAAAYALGNFTTVTGQDTSAVVNIGAPAANNAVNGCIANGGTCATTSAAGLRHAFQNAANLVSPFSPTANSKLPGNSLAQVPLQLINSIADIVVACVNSDGTAHACITLFGATGTDFTHGNTFEAVVNLAKNPTLAGTGLTPAQLLATATPQTNFYQPFLSTAPSDFSISILYPKGLGKTTGVQGLTYPYSGSLDINDNYYIGNYDSAAQTIANAASFTSSGTLVSFTPDDATNIAGSGASADAIGHFFLVGYTPSRPGAVANKFTVNNTTGAISPAPNSLFIGNDHPAAAAVDRANNLWFGSQSNPAIGELLVNDNALGITKGLLAPVTSISVDPDQNIWLTTNAANSSNGVGALENTGTVAAPTYAAASYVAAPLANLSASGISFAGTSSSFTGYVANTGTTPGITPVTPVISGAAVTSLTPGTHATDGTAPVALATDGANVVWTADGANLVKYTPGGSAITLVPCVVPVVTTNTACTTTPYSGIQSVSIDSTGSIWFVSSASGTVSEMIGAATPAWPLLSLGLLGEPQ
jgi:hypothetical protein